MFLIHEAKLQLYEHYIKASPRSVKTFELWRNKEPDFNKLVKLFQVVSSTCLYTYIHTYTRLTVLFGDYPGEPVPER